MPLTEYDVAGEMWRCECMEELVAEMENDLSKSNITFFHQFLEQSPHQFLIVRRLYGIQPLAPKGEFNVDDFQLWTMPDLAVKLNLTVAKIKETLTGIRGGWSKLSKKIKKEQEPLPTAPRAGTISEELDFQNHPLLKEFNFDISFRSQIERENFAKKVEGFERVLREPIVSGIAHNALNTRLILDRMQSKLTDDETYRKDAASFRKDIQLAQELKKSYDDSIGKILELCPWASEIAGKQALQPVLSTITQAYLEYKKRDDTTLRDGVFSSMGIAVEFRSSVQMPQPRYRLGLVLAINAAKEGIFDPTYKIPFSPAQLAATDRAFRELLKSAQNEQGIPVPDLQSDDPIDGEFEDLEKAKPE